MDRSLTLTDVPRRTHSSVSRFWGKQAQICAVACPGPHSGLREGLKEDLAGQWGSWTCCFFMLFKIHLQLVNSQPFMSRAPGLHLRAVWTAVDALRGCPSQSLETTWFWSWNLK